MRSPTRTRAGALPALTLWSGEHQNWQAFATNSGPEDQEIKAFAICKV